MLLFANLKYYEDVILFLAVFIFFIGFFCFSMVSSYRMDKKREEEKKTDV